MRKKDLGDIAPNAGNAICHRIQCSVCFAHVMVVELYWLQLKQHYHYFNLVFSVLCQCNGGGVILATT